MSYYDLIDQYRKSYRIYLPEGSTVYDAKNLLFSNFKIGIDRFDYVANNSRYALIDNYNLSQLARPLNYFEIWINPSFQNNEPIPPPQQSTFVPPSFINTGGPRSSPSYQPNPHINQSNMASANPYPRRNNTNTSEHVIDHNSQEQNSKQSYSQNSYMSHQNINQHQIQPPSKFDILLSQDLNYEEKTVYYQVKTMYPNITKEKYYRMAKYFKDVESAIAFMQNQEDESDDKLNSVEIPDDSKIEEMTKIFNSREKQLADSSEKIKGLIQNDPDLLVTYINNIKKTDLDKGEYYEKNSNYFLDCIGIKEPLINKIDPPNEIKPKEITAVEESFISKFSISQQEELINLRKYFWNNDKISMGDIVSYYEWSKYNIHLTKENLIISSSALKNST